MSKNSSKRNVKKNNKRLSTTQKIDTKKISETVDKQFESVKKISNTTLKSVNNNSNVKFNDTKKFDNTKVTKTSSKNTNKTKNTSKSTTKSNNVKKDNASKVKNNTKVRDNIIISDNNKNVFKSTISKADIKKDKVVKEEKEVKDSNTKSDNNTKSLSVKKVDNKRDEIIVADLSDQVTDSTIKLNKLRDEIYSLYSDDKNNKGKVESIDDTIVTHESFLSSKNEDIEVLEETDKSIFSNKLIKFLIIILSLIFIALLIFNIWLVIFIITF